VPCFYGRDDHGAGGPGGSLEFHHYWTLVVFHAIRLQMTSYVQDGVVTIF
jgi:hypothetical protein